MVGPREIGVTGICGSGAYITYAAQTDQVPIVDAATGEILRELTIDPAKDYQGTGRPPGPTPKKH